MHGDFCLVFTASPRWKVELRAKIGHYRNRCFVFLVVANGFVVSCPDDIHVVTKRNTAIEVNWKLPEARDKYGHPIKVVHQTMTSPVNLTEGVHTVHIIGEDSMSLTSVCSFKINVSG